MDATAYLMGWVDNNLQLKSLGIYSSNELTQYFDGGFYVELNRCNGKSYEEAMGYLVDYIISIISMADHCRFAWTQFVEMNPKATDAWNKVRFVVPKTD